MQDIFARSNDGINSTYIEDFNTLSQEIRVSGGEGSNFQWIAGVYGSIEQLDTSINLAFGTDMGPVAGSSDTNVAIQDTYVLASFGQIIYKPISKLELTASARIDYERKDKTYYWEFKQASGFSMGGKAKRSNDWLALSPSFSAAWLFTDEHRVYASLSRGFKAGGFNVTFPIVAKDSDVLNPEFTTTYEIGYKGQFFNNRLETNLALFYIDWEDMQVDVIIGVNRYIKVNAGAAHSSGIELETRVLLMPNWEAFLNVGYMFEYEFDKFERQGVDLKGNKLPGTNKFTVSVGSVYRTDFGMFLSFNASYQGEKYLTEVNRYKEDPLLLVNAKIGYEAENWDIYLYGKNLLDERYATFANDFQGDGTIIRMADPLTIGAAFNIRF